MARFICLSISLLLFAFSGHNSVTLALNQKLLFCTDQSKPSVLSRRRLFVSTSEHSPSRSRRNVLQQVSNFLSVNVLIASILPLSPSYADTGRSGGGKFFAPGGTLVEYEVGVTVGNSMASKSRRADNSNVVFSQDYYYKFGTAPPFIDSDSNDFPKTMPFTPSQQRYDTLKKYRDRVQRGISLIAGLEAAISKGEYEDIPDGSSPEYSIRPFGLLANGFLASENTGTTNELLLARWYINEIALDIDDIKSAASKENATASFKAAKKSLNSYLCLINRVITSKVGDPFALI